MSKSAGLRGSVLHFQDISSKLSSEELVKRLRACSKFLAETEDLEDRLTSPLASLSAVLVEPFIHHHKTRDVRLLAACCMAELFRLFYPDPPYDEDQLKVVFSLFVTQLQGLEKPDAPAFRSSFHLLECLATTKAFNLCLSLDSQELLADLFKMVFSIVNDQQSSKVKMYMMDIMSSVFQEGETLSQEILDAILTNFIEPTKSNSKAVYKFAAEFVRKTSQYLEPYIQLFFNNALVVGHSAESEVGDHIYELILELHAIDSSILLSVLPQLEFKLKSTDTEERLEVTRLLARMFSPRESRLATENKSLWICFLGRFVDVSLSVRVECIRYSKYFLVYHPHLAAEVVAHLHTRIYENSEKIRMECVRAISEAAADCPNTVPQLLYKDLQERMRDKSWSIRKESMTNLARLYRQIMSSSTSSSEAGVSRLDADRMAWIPNKILHSYYLVGQEDHVCVERCFLSCLVPLSLPSEDRMQRLSHIFSRFDEHASRAFEELLRTREQSRCHFTELIEVYHNEDMAEERKKEVKMTKIIQLARQLPDPVRCQTHLRELSVMLDDDRLRQHLLDALQLTSTSDDVIKSKGAALSKIGTKHGIVETVKTLLDRCCPMLIDSKCVSLLVEECVGQLCEPSLSQTAAEEKQEASRAKKTVRLLRVMAELTPSQFATSDVFENLLSLLRHDDSEIVGDTLQILTHTGANIDQTIAGCLQPILTKLAQSGPPQLARHTIRCIAAVFSEPTPILHRVFKSLLMAMEYDHPHLLTTLSSMEELAESFPSIFQTSHKKVIKEFVVKKLLVVDRAKSEYREGDPEWCSNERVSYETQAKVLGLQLLVSWLVGLQNDFEHFANPVLRLLDMVLAHDGDLQGEENISAHDRSRLRRAASCGLLKLAQSSHYQELISQPQFQRLSLTIQDTCDEVRDGFVSSLNQGLRTLKLPLLYLAVFALAGVEPRLDSRVQLRQIIANNVGRRRDCVKHHSKAKTNLQVVLPEYAVPYAVYLISHHPQFSRTNPRSLDTFRDCLWFFLEPLAKGKDNYSFLRKMLETIKQTVDAQQPDDPEASKNMYAVCDLAMGVLTRKLTNIKLGEFPGNVLLPFSLFKPRPQDAPTNTACYLPPDYNCTPTKQKFKGESVNPSASVDAEFTQKKGRKGAGRGGRTPSKTTRTPTKAGGGGGGKRRTPQKKAATKGKRGRDVDEGEEENVADAGGVSDVEGEEEEEEEASPRKRRAGARGGAVSAEPTRKRVSRKILQEDHSAANDQPSSQETEEKETGSVHSEKTSPPESRRGRGGRRGRRRKREETGEEEKRETEDEDAHHANGVDSSISESNEVLESSPAAPKKAKVAEEATSEDSVKTAPMRRRMRRRK